MGGLPNVQNVQNVRSRCYGRGVFMGGLPNVQNVQNVRSKFFEKNAFYVLTSEKYGVIYPAGKNNKKKYIPLCMLYTYRQL